VRRDMPHVSHRVQLHSCFSSLPSSRGLEGAGRRLVGRWQVQQPGEGRQRQAATGCGMCGVCVRVWSAGGAAEGGEHAAIRCAPRGQRGGCCAVWQARVRRAVCHEGGRFKPASGGAWKGGTGSGGGRCPPAARKRAQDRPYAGVIHRQAPMRIWRHNRACCAAGGMPKQAATKPSAACRPPRLRTV